MERCQKGRISVGRVVAAQLSDVLQRIRGAAAKDAFCPRWQSTTGKAHQATKRDNLLEPLTLREISFYVEVKLLTCSHDTDTFAGQLHGGRFRLP